jgi:hypothetical protein
MTRTLITHLIAGALLVASTFVATGPASARQQFQVAAQYFAGSDMIRLVGEVYINCDGTGSQWGVRTPYVIREVTPCP